MERGVRQRPKVVKLHQQFHWNESCETKPDVKLITKIEPKNNFEPIQSSTIKVATPALSPVKCGKTTVNTNFRPLPQSSEVRSIALSKDPAVESQLSTIESQNRNYIGSMASIAYQTMDEKMEEFFRRFEKTLRTNLSSVASNASFGTIKEDKDCQTDDSVYKEMSTNTDASHFRSKKRKVRAFNQHTSKMDKEAMSGVKDVASPTNQNSRIESFFTLNPNLLPFDAKTPLSKKTLEVF